MAVASEEFVARFLREARAIVGRAEPDDVTLRSLGDLLRQLAAESAAVATRDLAALHGTSAAARVIGSEGPEGLTLMLARFPETDSTPVHDHGSWGVACLVRGRDRYTAWERIDDGSDPENARLRVREERELRAGDIVWWLGPPHDIHGQQGVGEPAIELVLFGRDATKIPRHYFDPATGKVRTALPQ